MKSYSDHNLYLFFVNKFREFYVFLNETRQKVKYYTNNFVYSNDWNS